MTSYKIQHEEWLENAKALKHGELLILYYFRTNPAATPTTKALAQALGISQRTAQRSLARLIELKKLDVQRVNHISVKEGT